MSQYTTGLDIASFLGLSDTETDNKGSLLQQCADAINAWLDTRVSFDGNTVPAPLAYAANLMGGRLFNRSNTVMGAMQMGHDSIVWVSGMDRDAERMLEPYRTFNFG